MGKIVPTGPETARPGMARRVEVQRLNQTPPGISAITMEPVERWGAFVEGVQDQPAEVLGASASLPTGL